MNYYIILSDVFSISGRGKTCCGKFKIVEYLSLNISLSPLGEVSICGDFNIHRLLTIYIYIYRLIEK